MAKCGPNILVKVIYLSECSKQMFPKVVFCHAPWSISSERKQLLRRRSLSLTRASMSSLQTAAPNLHELKSKKLVSAREHTSLKQNLAED